MGSVSLCLLVLKTRDIQRLRIFYQAIGLEFDSEQHGSGPMHYAAKVGDAVLEIYPAADTPVDAKAVRLGFRVANMPDAIEALRRLDGVIIGEPTSSEWGTRAVMRDPDGRAVELYGE